ncbi:MAG: TIGR04076 family protein [Candidatus Bathyarchaeia archaeon]
MVKVVAEVISQKGKCTAGHEVGDRITFDWDTHEIDGRICLHALYSIIPKIYAMAQGGDVAFFEREGGVHVARHACPDGYNPVIFELHLEE